MTPILNIQNLTIRRGTTTVLKDVDWRLDPGQHWVILGSNGSGKTSLLSALTGYFMPTRGSLQLLGETYGEADWRALRTRVGLVSSSIRQMMPEDEPALLTVAAGRRAMIDFWGPLRSPDRRAANTLLRRIGCLHLARRPWAVLSQGERQRILIARALMARPKLLILDEPCAGLDPVAREHFLQFVEHLGRTSGGPALVLVTHHVEEITPAFTHALILHQGSIHACGPLQDVLTSSNLSAAFNSPVRVRRQARHWTLGVPRLSSRTRWI